MTMEMMMRTTQQAFRNTKRNSQLLLIVDGFVCVYLKTSLAYDVVYHIIYSIHIFPHRAQLPFVVY